MEERGGSEGEAATELEAGKEGVRWREHNGAKYGEGHKDRCNDVWNGTYQIRFESQSCANVPGLVRSDETPGGAIFSGSCT